MISFACLLYYAVCTLWQLASVTFTVFKIHPCCCKNLRFTCCCWFVILHHVNTDIWVVSKMYISMSNAARISLVFSKWKSRIIQYENVQLCKLMPVFQSGCINLPSPAADKISKPSTSSPTFGFVRHLNFPQSKYL